MKKNITVKLGTTSLIVESVPITTSKYGDVIQMDPLKFEQVIAKAVIKHGLPISGRHVSFLRKAIGLSMDKLAKHLGLTAPAILKWERLGNKRLSPINEAALRSLFAELLHIEIEGTFTTLVGLKKAPKTLKVKLVS